MFAPRRKKSAAERRAQKERANARTIGRILRSCSSLLSHRGCSPSAAHEAIACILQGASFSSQPHAPTWEHNGDTHAAHAWNPDATAFAPGQDCSYAAPGGILAQPGHDSAYPVYDEVAAQIDTELEECILSGEFIHPGLQGTPPCDSIAEAIDAECAAQLEEYFAEEVGSPTDSLMDYINEEAELQYQGYSPRTAGAMMGPMPPSLQMSAQASPNPSCREFLQMVELVRRHIPHIRQPPQPLLMICDGCAESPEEFLIRRELERQDADAHAFLNMFGAR